MAWGRPRCWGCGPGRTGTWSRFARCHRTGVCRWWGCWDTSGSPGLVVVAVSMVQHGPHACGVACMRAGGLSGDHLLEEGLSPGDASGDLGLALSDLLSSQVLGVGVRLGSLLADLADLVGGSLDPVDTSSVEGGHQAAHQGLVLGAVAVADALDGTTQFVASGHLGLERVAMPILEGRAVDIEDALGVLGSLAGRGLSGASLTSLAVDAGGAVVVGVDRSGGEAHGAGPLSPLLDHVGLDAVGQVDQPAVLGVKEASGAVHAPVDMPVGVGHQEVPVPATAARELVLEGLGLSLKLGQAIGVGDDLLLSLLALGANQHRLALLAAKAPGLLQHVLLTGQGTGGLVDLGPDAGKLGVDLDRSLCGEVGVCHDSTIQARRRVRADTCDS